MTRRSHFKGCSSFLWNPIFCGLNSKRRWMVFASRPVASLILLAALPVGAASRMSIPRRPKIVRIALMMVVFPVPGPPVMTMTLLFTADFTASNLIGSQRYRELLLNPFNCLFRVDLAPGVRSTLEFLQPGGDSNFAHVERVKVNGNLRFYCLHRFPQTGPQ